MNLAIKAVEIDGEWVLDVLAIPFGGPSDRDSDGEYFTKRTRLHLDRYTPQPIYYHNFDERKRKMSKVEFIGKTIKHMVKDDGVWLRVVLDKTVERAKKVWDAAKRKAAVASSGTVQHLRDVAPTGEILEWPFVEISIWDLTPDRPQANKRAIALPALKAAGLPIDDKEFSICESEDRAEENPDQGSGAGGDSSSHIISSSTKDSRKMDYEKTDEKPDVQALVADAVKSALEAAEKDRAAQAEAKAAQDAAIAEAVKAATEEAEAKAAEELEALKAEQIANRRLPFGDAPNQAQFGNLRQYDNVDPDDLAFAWEIMGAAKMDRSEDMAKYIAVGFAESDDPSFNAAKGAMKMAGMPMKANELNQSTLSSYGDEWVGTGLSSRVWEKVRLETPIVSMLPAMEIRQGVESETIPYDVASPTFYRVAQASAQDANPGRITQTFTSSKLTTGQRVLNAQKIGAFVPWAQELTEDSMVQWIQFLRQDLIREYAEILEHCVIDGDTDTSETTNINDIGGTPAGTEPYTMFDGFRKLALITNSANSVSGTTLAASDYIDTVKMLGTAGVNGWDKSKVFLTSDINTAYATLKIATLESRDALSAPTIESGRITQLYGYNIYPSANMHRMDSDRLANASGLVDQDTVSNNAKGAIVAVRADQWMFGYKRRVTFEVNRDPGSDANEIYMHSRVGLIYRDTEASAVSYNITVA